MQVLNTPSLSGMWGEALGTGLGGALQQIAQAKVRDLNSVKTYNYLKEMPGFNQEQAKAISLLDPSMQELAIKSAQNAYASNAIGSALNKMFGNQNVAPSQSNQQQGPINLTERFSPNNTQPLSTQQQVRPQQIRPSVQPTMQKASERAASEQMFENPNAFPQVAAQPQPNRVDLSNAPIDFRTVPANQLMQLAGLGMQAQAAQHKNALDEAKLEQGERGLALKERLGEGRLGIQERGVSTKEERIKQQEEQLGLKKKEFEKEVKKDWKVIVDSAVKRKEDSTKKKSEFEGMIKAAKAGYRSPLYTQFLRKFDIDTLAQDKNYQLIKKLSSAAQLDIIRGAGSQSNMIVDKLATNAVANELNSPEAVEAIGKMYIASEKYEALKAEEEIKYYNKHKDELVPPSMQAEIEQSLSPERQKLLNYIENIAIGINPKIGDTVNSGEFKGNYGDLGVDDNTGIEYMSTGLEWVPTGKKFPKGVKNG